MNAITLRNVPAEIQAAIEERARAEGLSFDKTVIRMLKELVGAREGSGLELHHDLDHLAGTWSEEEAEAFESALEEQRKINAELWE